MSFPAAHRAKLQSTNSIERLNGEIKRRTDVVGADSRHGSPDMPVSRGGGMPGSRRRRENMACLFPHTEA
jgi:hypothetical protein